MPAATTDLSMEQVAVRLGWSTRTLYARIRNGGAPPSYLRGNRRLFPEDQFDRWLAEQRAAAK
jgi:excisionase family DNA binding protein